MSGTIGRESRMLTKGSGVAMFRSVGPRRAYIGVRKSIDDTRAWSNPVHIRALGVEADLRMWTG